MSEIVWSLAATVARCPWRRSDTLTPSAPPTVARASATTRRRAPSTTSVSAEMAVILEMCGGSATPEMSSMRRTKSEGERMVGVPPSA